MRTEQIYGEWWVVKREPMSRIRQQVAAQWNAGNSLSQAVKAIGEKHTDEIIGAYRDFHRQYGKGYKIPVTHVIGSRMRVSECSDDWLAHHGISRDGSTLANFFKKLRNS